MNKRLRSDHGIIPIALPSLIFMVAHMAIKGPYAGSHHGCMLQEQDGIVGRSPEAQKACHSNSLTPIRVSWRAA